MKYEYENEFSEQQNHFIFQFYYQMKKWGLNGFQGFQAVMVRLLLPLQKVRILRINAFWNYCILGLLPILGSTIHHYSIYYNFIHFMKNQLVSARLWTDGRYFVQAADQLDCNWYLMKMVNSKKLFCFKINKKSEILIYLTIRNIFKYLTKTQIFLDSYIFPTWWYKSLIFQTCILFSNRLFTLKYLRSV